MKNLPGHILSATRLTRQGRLKEATALLQANLRQALPPEASAPSGGLPSALVHLDPAAARPAAARLAVRRARSRPPASRNVPGDRFESRTFAGPAGSRPYKLYIPSLYCGQPLPLIVMLHGCTQSPDDFAAGTRMNEQAEAHGFVVAYPAQIQSANMSRCWNWFEGKDQQRGGGEPAILAGLTREVMDDLAIHPDRVFVAGLSAGGAAAAILGATYPDLYAAVGVHSGLACGSAHDMSSAFAAMQRGGSPAPRTMSPGRLVPTIVFHGDSDATVNAVNGEQVIAHAGAGFDLRSETVRGRSQDGVSFTRTVSRDRSGDVALEHWLVHGGGHAWSGGSAAGSFTDSRGPDASAEMARFFLRR
ncbi:MAG: PHB depolymerase family esterase [Alphaproteobacteria bacterium]|nr:PHB depolymerase family esterase [Alphaproteobacteria bacterium]